MYLKNYIKANLIKTKPLYANVFIFKTPEIIDFLKSKYGSENVKFDFFKSQEINKNLIDHFGVDYIEKIKAESEKINYEILENLEKFLHDAVLAINLYHPLKIEIDNSLQEIFNKKMI